MASEADKKRAQAMKDGPNTIIEDVGPQKPKRTPVIEVQKKEEPPAAEKSAERVLEAMPLRHFLALEFGAKYDQCAGFAVHAKRMGPRTIHEWRAEFAKFMAKPIK
jgi:hypothetical protein